MELQSGTDVHEASSIREPFNTAVASILKFPAGSNVLATLIAHPPMIWRSTL
jgi:hypothetical protein